MAHDNLLSYLYFNKQSGIHTGASNNQLGAVIRQNGKPIPLYSHKWTEMKTQHTVTEKEFLNIVETHKEFRKIY